MLSISIKIEGIGKVFHSRSGAVPVLTDVEFELRQGETFGILGTSGSGKTTLAKIIIGRDKPTKGTIRYQGKSLWRMNRAESARYRRNIQMLYQNPQSSLNPKKTIQKSLMEICVLLKLQAAQSELSISRVLTAVGLSRDLLIRFPGQLSGGQNQRAALARILLLDPDYIILDEPVSSLDSSARAQMLHLLKNLQHRREMGFLLISHDRDVIEFLSHQAASLQQGKLLPARRLESGGFIFHRDPEDAI